MIQAVDDPRYVPVSVSTLVLDRCAGFRLYLQVGGGATSMRLYCAENVAFEDHHLDNLRRSGRTTVYISASDQELYQQYLRENLSTILHDELVEVRERFSALNMVVRDVLAESFRASAKDPKIDKMREIADLSVELLFRDDFVVRDVIGVLHHDYQTFTHSANVSFYCVLLAKSLGMDDVDTLREIALGGFLHDLGKLHIPERILNKPGRLTQAEREIVNEHPATGFRMLARRADISRAQLMMVYQHHEQVDGGGYPVGCGRSELHEWARLCSVVDVFEALTSDRPYRARLPRSEAFQILDRYVNKKLEGEFVECWKNTITRDSTSC